MSAGRLLSALALLLLAAAACARAASDRLFNDGKPFYVARDPVTGAIDFDHRNDLQQPAYPLISSSYANTKVQGHGNVRRQPPPPRAPTAAPVYHYSSAPAAVTVPNAVRIATDYPPVAVLTTTAAVTTTTSTTSSSSSSSATTAAPVSSNVPLAAAHTSTTRRPYISFFEDLFGDYDGLQNGEADGASATAAAPTTAAPQDEAYEEEYEYGPLQALDPERDHPTAVRPQEFVTTSGNAASPMTTAATSRTAPTTTTVPTVPTVTAKVTSMPLGDNHPTHGVRWQSTSMALTRPSPRPTAAAVRERPVALLRPAPSTSSVHIAPDQDVVSFVVGNHQHVDESPYMGAPVADAGYTSNSFRPLYFRRPPLPPLPSLAPTTPSPAPQTSAPTQQPATAAVAAATRDPMHHAVRFPDEKGEILSLYSRPMLHQLPAELTPPAAERQEPAPPSARPPWDPRPGHFYQGRPEYAQPPRAPVRPPPRPEVYKRVDGLPNILPQFRPNTRGGPRPAQPSASFFGRPAGPPRIPVANRRSGDDHVEVATLQMIQAKQAAVGGPPPPPPSVASPPPPPPPPHRAASTERPLYVVYPVNSSPIKMDALDGAGERESVVIGTRGEQLPLPPSRIAQEPVLRPQARPPPAAAKPADFPYLLERPASTAAPVPAVQAVQAVQAAPAAAPERGGSEFTVSAVMHTRPAHDNHRRTGDALPPPPPPQDFQAPFQPSVSVDAQGWAAAAPAGGAALPAAPSAAAAPTAAPFNADHFEPQLYGGFRPIYGADAGDSGAAAPP